MKRSGRERKAYAVKDNPELLKQIQEQNTLEIEGGDNDTLN